MSTKYTYCGSFYTVYAAAKAAFVQGYVLVYRQMLVDYLGLCKLHTVILRHIFIMSDLCFREPRIEVPQRSYKNISQICICCRTTGSVPEVLRSMN